LQLSRLVDKKLRPRKVEIVVSLQTFGTAISKLTLSYRAAGSISFSEVACSQSADLGYVARFPYADAVEYFFVATPAVGSTIRFGDGKIIGSDIKSQKPMSRPLAPALVGAVAGAVVLLVSIGVGGGETASANSKPTHTNNTRLYVGVGLGAVTAAVTYLFLRHRRTVHGSPKDPQHHDRVSECHQ
jgi:hypothetical protein